MSILTGPEIHRQYELGNIDIVPFDSARLGPNSYDVSLDRMIVTLEDLKLDICKPVRDAKEYIMSDKGFDLMRFTGYLATTHERIRSDKYVPFIDGRSTLGRYFVTLHCTAGRGDDGFDGRFTCEILTHHRIVTIYPFVPIGQIYFFTIEGERKRYEGRYQGQIAPQIPKPLPKYESKGDPK